MVALPQDSVRSRPLYVVAGCVERGADWSTAETSFLGSSSHHAVCKQD